MVYDDYINTMCTEHTLTHTRESEELILELVSAFLVAISLVVLTHHVDHRKPNNKKIATRKIADGSRASLEKS